MGITLHPGNDADCTTYNPLRRLDMVQYARDGITLPRYYRNPTVWVSPGYRVDSFVQMPASPQPLCLVGRRTHDPLASVIGIIEVRADAPRATATELPPRIRHFCARAARHVDGTGGRRRDAGELRVGHAGAPAGGAADAAGGAAVGDADVRGRSV